jgi:hypothetical protein
MAHKPYSSLRSAPLRKRRSLLPTAVLVAISLSPVAYFVDFGHPADAPPAAPSVSVASPAPAPQAPKVASAFDPALIDPTPALKQGALAFARNAPLQTTFKPQSTQREAHIQPTPPHEPAPAPQAAPSIEVAQAVPTAPAFVPLPVPRPADLGAPKLPTTQPVARATVAVRPPVPVAAPADNRNFIEKLFGIRPASPPDAALGYASLDEKGTGSISPTARFSPAPDLAGGGTAVYDIAAQIVTMPNGERLEAHSGLGDMMDNPRYVNVRMRGATPPGTYVLTEREALFHGVRAIRLNPVGGSAAIYGRAGILAHTYMLGPRGDSNGCVSFKDYDRFLQAYLRGEVKRLIVTAGRGQDLLPPMAGSRTQPSRLARAF